jgi:hypothetical protein
MNKRRNKKGLKKRLNFEESKGAPNMHAGHAGPIKAGNTKQQC